MGKDRESGRNTDPSRPTVGDGAVRRQRSKLGSKFAFSSALTVLMLGTFVSLGGLGYAASQSKNAVHTITKVAAARKIVVLDSSASGQYHKKPSPGKKQIFSPPSGPGSTGTVKQDGTLPFTGLSLVATALVSGLLLLLGIMLRRRERRSS